jgi:transcriptional regulator with XRE-family HTH domain
MKKTATAGERIRAIRGEKSQEEFGKLLDSSQGAVSAWERDDKDRSPSAAIYFRFAALANDFDDSVFFLEQAGLQPDAVVTVANMLLKRGEVNMDAILATAESRLIERFKDHWEIQKEGKDVIARPFPGDPSMAQYPNLNVPGMFVSTVASLYYIVAPASPFGSMSPFGSSSPFRAHGGGFAPGDLIFFEGSNVEWPDIEKYIGESVLLRLKQEAGMPGGLFIGRLGFINEGDKKHIVAAPRDIHPSNWSRHTPLLNLGGSHGKSEEFRSRARNAGGTTHQDWYNAPELLGKVVALFNCETVEQWKRSARG